MKSLASYLTPSLLEPSKHEWEYQELGVMLEPIYGKGIWPVFYKPYATEYKIRQAHEIAKKRGITKLNYLIGIIRKL